MAGKVLLLSITLLFYFLVFISLAAPGLSGGIRAQLDGHEFEQDPGVGDGQGSPVCFSP